MKSDTLVIFALMGMISNINLSLAMPKASPSQHEPRPPAPTNWQPHPPPPPAKWPPPQPPKKCDACEVFKFGISETKPLLKWIKKKAQKAPDCVADVIVRTGPFSAASDDAISSVDCPQDYTVVNCRCDTEDTGCDGSLSRGRTCYAFKASGGGPGIRAIATCVPSCTGKFLIEQEPVAGYANGFPTATCPVNTEIIGCWIHSFWRLRLTNIDESSRTCRPATDCNQGDGCSVQALCRVKRSHKHDLAKPRGTLGQGTENTASQA